uniref:Transposase n=1 Tax=Strongyloides papillosus TaxID=174720 RepID=A0A0N5CDV9_STREA
CSQLVKKKFGLTFGGQVIIVQDNRYDEKALIHTESFRKAMFQKRRGIVFHKGQQLLRSLLSAAYHHNYCGPFGFSNYHL